MMTLLSPGRRPKGTLRVISWLSRFLSAGTGTGDVVEERGMLPAWRIAIARILIDALGAGKFPDKAAPHANGSRQHVC